MELGMLVKVNGINSMSKNNVTKNFIWESISNFTNAKLKEAKSDKERALLEKEFKILKKDIKKSWDIK